MARTGFGFAGDNFLGNSPQDNSWKGDFATFMVENRLLPQLERATTKFSSKWGTSNEDASAFKSMGALIFERAKDVLGPVADAKPSLLHGGKIRALVLFLSYVSGLFQPLSRHRSFVGARVARGHGFVSSFPEYSCGASGASASSSLFFFSMPSW